jgi:hypothetical protein
MVLAVSTVYGTSETVVIPEACTGSTATPQDPPHLQNNGRIDQLMLEAACTCLLPRRAFDGSMASESCRTPRASHPYSLKTRHIYIAAGRLSLIKHACDVIHGL